ncbi:trypsin-like peptidase domain-containing protein [Natronospira bacteriovora]|uniref:Trypsin-like peptidase domain-containing protein n=1 Tax=Natronospira bacteriovora TaxID=3069753 RepID=A0ABU0W6D4_9GAMM|nr:trypsin-like peptidase domain-containing protein [Natronospira sp. AB-CW4]MDQ2069527.1 trypsin-like peptidase domain-containing protein [Natronospira sp. AB-CW4]
MEPYRKMPNPPGWLSTWMDFLAKSVVVGLAAAFVVVYFRPELLTQRQAVDSYAAAVERSTPSVVNVHTARRVEDSPSTMLSEPFWQRFFGDAPGLHRERIESSLGSGVIVSPEGHILTSNHVIEGADEIRVALHDGRVSSAEIVGTDPETDLALLKIDASNLPVIAFGRSERLRVGDVTLAIGNPVGLGQSVSQGIVSATGRSQLGITLFENFIQTDAAINIGNSGGALVDSRGRLIGINTAMLSGENGGGGIGFAIPVNLARGVMEQIIEHGRVIRGYLGIAPQTLSPELAESFGLEAPAGVVVTNVQRASPADQAGIRPGDIVTHINGRPILDDYDALNKVASLQPGELAEVRLIRDEQTLTVHALIAERGIPGRN